MNQDRHGGRGRGRRADGSAAAAESPTSGSTIRSCVGCGGKGEPASLVRLTADAAGRARLDPERRLGGRGAWLHPAPACLARALKRGSLGRALRRDGLLVDGTELSRGLTEIGRRD